MFIKSNMRKGVFVVRFIDLNPTRIFIFPTNIAKIWKGCIANTGRANIKTRMSTSKERSFSYEMVRHTHINKRRVTMLLKYNIS